jgi:hypothetical protein
MSEIVKKNALISKAEIEIGKPFEINIELEKTFDTICVSIGYIVRGVTLDDRNVVFYDNFFSKDTLSVCCIIDENAPPTYKGKIISVEWFILFESGDDAQVVNAKAYPMNYFKKNK